MGTTAPYGYIKDPADHNHLLIDDEYEDSIVGTPQGGNLSPLLANTMLNELDKEMEKRGLNFVRYADDCIITVSYTHLELTEKELRQAHNLQKMYKAGAFNGR